MDMLDDEAAGQVLADRHETLEARGCGPSVLQVHGLGPGKAGQGERGEVSSGRGACCQGGRMAEPVEAPLSVVFSSIPGAQGQVTAWEDPVQVDMWARADRIRLQGRSVDGGWPGWLRPLSNARVVSSFSDVYGSLTQAPALFNRATAGAAGVRFRAQRPYAKRKGVSCRNWPKLSCGCRFSTRATSIYERLWRTESRVGKTMPCAWAGADSWLSVSQDPPAAVAPGFAMVRAFHGLGDVQ